MHILDWSTLLLASLLQQQPEEPVTFGEDPLVWLATHFIGMFQQGGETFVGLVTGILPTLIVLLTGVNALIALIGPERIDRVGEWAGRPGLIYYPIRYLVLPVLACFFLTNPMAYTMGRFLPERYKPAFYDATVSFVHPPLGLFPHINPGELFVWLGIATGIQRLGLPLAPLAVRYLLVGLIVIFIRGIVTERITAFLMARQVAVPPEEFSTHRASTEAADTEVVG
jgi:glucitol/sorbitol PTS system EIIC component